jgi:hypothetical protein
VVRANFRGVFRTYKRLRDGTRKAYWYHRATGKRLDGEPGSREFVTSFAVAEQSVQTRLADGDTFAGLVRDYTLSTEFERTLALSTQTAYRRMLTKADPVFGDMPVQALDDWRVRKEFLDWREKVARQSGPREADHRLSTVSAMLTWAVEHGKLAANHVKGFKRLYHGDRSEIIWLPEHINAFMTIAPVELARSYSRSPYRSARGRPAALAVVRIRRPDDPPQAEQVSSWSEARPPSRNSVHASLAANARWHGAEFAPDTRHEDRAILQEEVLYRTLDQRC